MAGTSTDVTERNYPHADIIQQIHDCEKALAYAKLARESAFKQDLSKIEEEAKAAGFNDIKMGMASPRGYLLPFLYIHINNQTCRLFLRANKLTWCYEIDDYGSNVLVKPEDFTAEQRFFLDWSRTYADKLLQFWEGKTKFNTVQDLIEDMKMDYEPILSKNDFISHSIKPARK